MWLISIRLIMVWLISPLCWGVLFPDSSFLNILECPDSIFQFGIVFIMGMKSNSKNHLWSCFPNNKVELEKDHSGGKLSKCWIFTFNSLMLLPNGYCFQSTRGKVFLKKYSEVWFHKQNFKIEDIQNEEKMYSDVS